MKAIDIIILKQLLRQSLMKRQAKKMLVNSQSKVQRAWAQHMLMALVKCRKVGAANWGKSKKK